MRYQNHIRGQEYLMTSLKEMWQSLQEQTAAYAAPPRPSSFRMPN